MTRPRSAGPPAAVAIAATPQQTVPFPTGFVLRAESAVAAEKARSTCPEWYVPDPTGNRSLYGLTSATPIDGLDGWYELSPRGVPSPATSEESTSTATAPETESPGDSQREFVPRSLGGFWTALRRLRTVDGIMQAFPLLVISNPQPATQVEAEAFSMGAGQHQFGAWGAPYDRSTEYTVEMARQRAAWHLAQMKVGQAQEVWQRAFPTAMLGAGARIALLDTGYAEHPLLTSTFEGTGRSFLLRGVKGRLETEQEARDDLHLDYNAFLQFPGHGTAVASAIVGSGRPVEDPNATQYVVGLAPGARVVPFRVCRSIQTFDFRAIGSAILAAVASNADVISVSVGSTLRSDYVHECVRQAHRAGIIVVATAGTAVPATAFPGVLPEVVGVAATHSAGGGWRFSGAGRFVDVAAPGEQIWCARASRKGAELNYTVAQTSSSGIATGLVAGLAAIWLAYHGGRDKIAARYAGRSELIPLAFKYTLTRSAVATPSVLADGMYGTGIPDAEKLLQTELPNLEQLERYAEVVYDHMPPRLALVPDGLAAGPDGVLRAIAPLDWAATVDSNGNTRHDPVAETEAAREVHGEQTQESRVLNLLLGSQAEMCGEELVARVATDRVALVHFRRVQQNESALPLLQRLLGSTETNPAGPQRRTPYLSTALSRELQRVQTQQIADASKLGSGKLTPPVEIVYPTGPHIHQPLAPEFRNLRVYAFDPSLDTKLETAPITQVTIRAPWEAVKPGPIGEYLEVIDVDPASACTYAPIDLNHPRVLAQNGVPPSEGDPYFHQQMVYAVAMNTIQHFERALGRPIFWSPLRPWLQEVPQEAHHFTSEALEQLGYANNIWIRRSNWQKERYVQRLRIYPHALREANAYYSPSKRALLFGYFPASTVDTGTHYPGGMVFSCLSHDIIAHETTHAVLDGMHPYFNEPSNEDVLAFHEAFADIVALLQHFTYPDVLRHQLANTRGELETDNLLAHLAQQFGQATGRRGALRDALGGNDNNNRWQRRKPNPHELRKLREPHERGGILIAAVFNAFLDLYHDQIADLLRIYTGGTGVLPSGQLHPDLINRLAIEAAEIAECVLRICIRAMDYMPPVDPTFGEFLRALITADYDLSPHEGRRNRIAFIDAFRSWGIYPPDVPTLSEETLRWQAPEPGSPLAHLDLSQVAVQEAAPGQSGAAGLLDALAAWQRRLDVNDQVSTQESLTSTSRNPRTAIFQRSQETQRQLHAALTEMQKELSKKNQSLIPGLDLRDEASFSVANLRPAQRIGSQGEYRTEMVVEIVQTARCRRPTDVPARGGATLVVDLRTWNVRYIVYKRLYTRLLRTQSDTPFVNRIARMRVEQAAVEGDGWWETGNQRSALADTYVCQPRSTVGTIGAFQNERFALLHRAEEF